MLVLTVGNGTHGFTLDREIGEFLLTHPDMRIPPETSSFAINTSNGRFWEPPIRRYVDECMEGRTGIRAKDFNMRWVASMVADVHRILVRGGVFMYPRDTRDLKNPGRLHLLHQGQPDGDDRRTGRRPGVDGLRAHRRRHVPTELHQHVPAILGSRNEVERINRYHTEHLNGEDQPFSSPLFSTRNLFRADYPASRPNQNSGAPTMSITHPIIAVTGSSGAGTTSVTRSFQHIFRRDKINAEIIEGDSFHRYDRAEMKAKMLERMAAGDNHFSHFGPEANLLGDLENLFREYGETGRGKRRHYIHDADEAKVYGTEPGKFTEWEDLPENTDLLFYEGLHGAVKTERYRRRAPRRPVRRRRADHQPRMDPEDPSRQVAARLLEGSGDGHHPAPHARLHQLHLPAVLTHARQFPARADGRHLESADCQRYPVARRELRRHPLRQPEGHRLPLPALDDPRLVHVASEHHRLPWRQDGAGHADHLHADDPAPDGQEAPRALNAQEDAFASLRCCHQPMTTGIIEMAMMPRITADRFFCTHGRLPKK
jgi:hypothetical protein